MKKYVDNNMFGVFNDLLYEREVFLKGKIKELSKFDNDVETLKYEGRLQEIYELQRILFNKN